MVRISHQLCQLRTQDTLAQLLQLQCPATVISPGQLLQLSQSPILTSVSLHQATRVTLEDTLLPPQLLQLRAISTQLFLLLVATKHRHHQLLQLQVSLAMVQLLEDMQQQQVTGPGPHLRLRLDITEDRDTAGTIVFHTKYYYILPRCNYSRRLCPIKIDE